MATSSIFGELEDRQSGSGGVVVESKLALPPINKKDQIETLLVTDFDAGIRNSSQLNTSVIKSLIKELALQLDGPLSTPLQAFFSLKKRLRETNTCLVKADKGETLILVSNDPYQHKITDFLLKAGATPTNLNINTHSELTREKIRVSKFVITGNQRMRERLYVMNFAFP